jgi:hypothetical protein
VEKSVVPQLLAFHLSVAAIFISIVHGGYLRACHGYSYFGWSSGRDTLEFRDVTVPNGKEEMFIQL